MLIVKLYCMTELRGCLHSSIRHMHAVARTLTMFCLWLVEAGTLLSHFFIRNQSAMILFPISMTSMTYILTLHPEVLT